MVALENISTTMNTFFLLLLCFFTTTGPLSTLAQLSINGPASFGGGGVAGVVAGVDTANFGVRESTILEELFKQQVRCGRNYIRDMAFACKFNSRSRRSNSMSEEYGDDLIQPQLRTRRVGKRSLSSQFLGASSQPQGGQSTSSLFGTNNNSPTGEERGEAAATGYATSAFNPRFLAFNDYLDLEQPQVGHAGLNPMVNGFMRYYGGVSRGRGKRDLGSANGASNSMQLNEVCCIYGCSLFQLIANC